MKPGCALPFTSGLHYAVATDFLTAATELKSANSLLIPAIPVANLVSVKRTAASACKRADSCAFSAADQSAENRAADSPARSRELVTMFLPERTVIIATLL